MSERTKKPIRIFYSELSGRLYASQQYSIKDGIATITGQKWDVTNDVGAIIERYELEFIRRKGQP